MITWINLHGLVIALGGWLGACIISCAPPKPSNLGFFSTWAWNIMQVFGASLDKVTRANPELASLTNTLTATKTTSIQVESNASDTPDKN